MFNILQSRRAVMQMLGLSTMAGPRALTELPSLLNSPSAMALVAGSTRNNTVGIEGPATSAVGSPLSRVVRNQLLKLKKRTDEDLWLRRNIRNYRFDGDIASMKSVSTINKQRMQTERELSYVELIARVDDAFGYW